MVANSTTIDVAATLKTANALKGKRLYHAALEAYGAVLDHCVHNSELGDLRAECFDGLGQTYLYLARYRESLHHFLNASQATSNPVSRCKYLEYEAIVHYRLNDYDRALRVLSGAFEECRKLKDFKRLSHIFVNLSFLQGVNRFYSNSIESARESLALAQQASVTPYYSEIYNNIGVAYLEQHMVAEAEKYLLKASAEESSSTLSSLMELSRVYFLKKDLNQSVFYGLKAVNLAWESIQNYEKDEIARLCRLLASVSFYLGEPPIAIRLLEKAQLMFGQLEMWREWDDSQEQMDVWLSKSAAMVPVTDAVSPDQIERFITLLDVVNAQELISPHFSILLDTRTLYVGLLSSALELAEIDRQRLVYACRFADYGLAALEQDVVLNPNRSRHAWSQYQEHPDLSVRMLTALQLEPEVLEIIADHHERYDGQGYPRCKSGDEIHNLAQVFAVADHYAHNVAALGMSHSQCLLEIVELSGSAFDPQVVKAFTSLFDTRDVGEEASS